MLTLVIIALAIIAFASLMAWATDDHFNTVDMAICGLWEMGRISDEEADRRIELNNERARRFRYVAELYKSA